MPFMVLLAVPLALFGALVALWLRGMQIDVYSQIGFVMLIGLAAKNAILIVEFARRRREEGLEIVEAAMEAARLRLRPILMTAFAFILGVVPLMVATGAGAASRQSIGTTVFGGMLAATILTLALRAGLLRGHRTMAGTPRRLTPPPRRTAHEPRRAGGIGIGVLHDAIFENRSCRDRRIVAAVAATIVVLDQRRSAHRRRRGRGAAAPRRWPCRSRWPRSSRRRSRSTWTIRPARKRSATSRCRPRSPGYIQQQHVADGADVKEGDLLYTIDPRDYPGRARSAPRRRCSATRRRSTMRRAISTAATIARPRAASSPRTPSTSAPARSARRSGAGDVDRPRSRTAELNLELYGNPRALRRPSRPQSGAGRHADQRCRHAAEHAGAARSDLRHLQSERDGSGRDPEGARARKGARPRSCLPGETKASHTGELTFVDNAVDRSTGTIVARATIDNADLSLLPGQYVRVRLQIRTSSPMR